MRSWFAHWKYIFLVVGLGMSVLLIIDFNSRMGEWRRLNFEREAVSTQAAHLVQTQTHLETQIAIATSPAGVREWVYQDGRWVQPGDVLVVPVEAGSRLAQPAQQPQTMFEVVDNWRLWLSLFFDQVFP